MKDSKKLRSVQLILANTTIKRFMVAVNQNFLEKFYCFVKFQLNIKYIKE